MCGRPPPHPSRAPSQGPRRCRQARGTPHSWGRFSSALGCSVAFQPSPPPLAGPRWAGAWVSLCLPVPSPSPGYKSWDICPAAESGPIQSYPSAQPQEAEETLGKSAEPFLPPGLETCCPIATEATSRGVREGWPRPHCILFWARTWGWALR